jgi:hypothetical protein
MIMKRLESCSDDCDNPRKIKRSKIKRQRMWSLRLYNRETCRAEWRIQRNKPAMIWLAESKTKKRRTRIMNTNKLSKRKSKNRWKRAGNGNKKRTSK